MGKQVTRTDREIRAMMQRIDEGILLAHKRLVQRAKINGYSLVVFRNGKVVEIDGSEFNI